MYILGRVDGNWGSWGSWSSCIHGLLDLKMDVKNHPVKSIPTNPVGFRSRSRSCNNPTPKNGGLSCPGASFSTEKCKISFVVYCMFICAYLL